MILKLEHQQGKIVVFEKDGTFYELVPFRETPDGLQQLFGMDEDLERIAASVTDQLNVPVDVIKKGFTNRTLLALEKSRASVETAKHILEAVYAKDAKTKKEQAPDASAIPAESP